MRANDTTPTSPTPDELTPLEISRAVLEDEENPNTLRAVSPLERAATGVDAAGNAKPRSAITRLLCNPAFAWGAAAAAGLGLVALAYANRESRPDWRSLARFRRRN
ncbi:hypothetical protein [Variovorax boronicumulans]|uniref:hypothetical protein n=1 Tax=Variovorax boronicumulans TaxID=436515 RepID=UPI0033951C9D